MDHIAQHSHRYLKMSGKEIFEGPFSHTLTISKVSFFLIMNS